MSAAPGSAASSVPTRPVFPTAHKPTRLQESMDSWFVRHVTSLKTAMRVIFGIVWAIDGAFKFQPGMPESIVGQISEVAQGQPSWLAPWFTFWENTVTVNPTLFVTLVGLSELALGFALIFGFMRKVAYTGGFFLSLVIWSVPEGFGGPYGPNSTDIGAGIVYSFVFLFLLILNAAYGPSRWSLDARIEKRFPRWRRIAELRGEPR